MEEYQFELIEDEHTREIRDRSIAQNQSNAGMRIIPSECVVNTQYKEFMNDILNFEVYPDDTWVITFPKCGTTWTQEMVWLLVNDLDYKTAREKPIRERFPFMELEAIMSIVQDRKVYPNTIQIAANVARPRCIKSHLPIDLLPKKLWTVRPKIVYVSRDPKDAIISYYHHHRLWNGYTGSFEDFAQVFLADRVVYAPFWKHVIDFWNIRHESNISFHSYEQMKQDLPDIVRKTAKFLDKQLTEAEVHELCDHLSFDKMKNNISVNYEDVSQIVRAQNNIKDKELVFIRNGQSGGWKKIFTKQLIDQTEEWCKDRLKDAPVDSYQNMLNALCNSKLGRLHW